jgi:maltose/moltooligosaccharide transporter
MLIGCGWAAMLAMPFAMLTNSLSGSSMGAYLGLFNCTICLPQIIAALLGGVILSLVGSSQVMMLVVAGVSLLCGAVAVFYIKEKTK